MQTDFWLVETIFFHYLIYFSRSPFSKLAETHFPVQKNSIAFLFRALFRASESRYLSYTEDYLKPVILLLATIFLIFWIFLSMEAVFLSNRNVFLNEFSISAGGNRLSV